MATKHTRTTPLADILVVDDEIASLRLLSEILTQAGYRVRPAERSQVALESAQLPFFDFLRSREL